MMLQKRLIQMVPGAKKHIAANIALQWLSLLANIALTACVCFFLSGLLTGQPIPALPAALFCFIMAALRFVCVRMASWQGYLSCRNVKHILRDAIYQKLLRLGPSYAQQQRRVKLFRLPARAWNSWKRISAPICRSCFTA